MDYIKRSIEKKIRKYLKRKEILAIVGARQVGKTTLMKHIFSDLKNAKFISFDDKETLAMFEQDLKLFIKTHIENVKYLFIDEFQYAKQGGKQLKSIYDVYKTKIIISGSSAPELTIESIKYLVGRIFVFTLFPFSFNEFLVYKDKKLSEHINEARLSEIAIEKMNTYYNEYVLFGGYPEVVLSNDKEEKREILKNIYNTYLLREIRDILQISDDIKLTKLIKALALQIGNLVNYNELSSIAGLEYRELIKYMNILKKTFICIESNPFFTNKRKELVKTPKIFFLDSGFRNMTIDNFQETGNRVDFGELNENFVASELWKMEFKLQYWRTKAGAEVDFVIEKNNKKIPLEVKTTLERARYGKALKNFIEEYGVETGFILSLKYADQIKLGKAKIIFAPLFSIHRCLK